MREIMTQAKNSLQEETERALSGDINPLEFMVKVSAMEAAIKEAKQQIMEVALEELEKHNEKQVELHGAKISKTAGGRYSYKHIEEWNNLNDLKKAIEKKAQEAFKAQMHGGSVVSDDGEVYEPAEYLPNKESISIKF